MLNGIEGEITPKKIKSLIRNARMVLGIDVVPTKGIDEVEVYWFLDGQKFYSVVGKLDANKSYSPTDSVFKDGVSGTVFLKSIGMAQLVSHSLSILPSSAKDEDYAVLGNIVCEIVGERLDSVSTVFLMEGKKSISYCFEDGDILRS